MIAAGWSEARCERTSSPDNQLALMPAGTRKCSRAELLDLQELAFDLDLIGFDGQRSVAATRP
jgi:hypothetical protein